MVCCCLPCIKKCQAKFESAETKEDIVSIGICTLVTTEICRWSTIIILLYLSIWQYTKYRGFTIFVQDADEEAQFWVIVTLIIVGVSLLIYLPLKLLVVRSRLARNKIKDHRWRPSIIVFIFGCALPCLVLILVAVKDPTIEKEGEATAEPDVCFQGETLDAETATVLQVVVFGLTITEWMSKLREEVVTYDLISAMAIDFFFAYDVIAFIMMMAYEPDIFNSEWVYVCFVFAWVAMFKYVPTQPVSIYENGAPKGAATGIMVTMFCNDIPFVVVRLSTMFIFGFQASDFIHPVKNIGMICFGLTQLFFIWRNSVDGKKQREARFSEKRISKFPGAWGDYPDDNRVTPTGDPEPGQDNRSVNSVGSTPSEVELRQRSKQDGDLEEIDLQKHGDLEVANLE